jgi:hypothetical protein
MFTGVKITGVAPAEPAAPNTASRQQTMKLAHRGTLPVDTPRAHMGPIVTGKWFLCSVFARSNGLRVGDTARVPPPKLLVALLVLGVVAGCGDDPAPSVPARQDRHLTAQERTSADHAVAAIRSYCRRVARSLAGRGAAPPVEDAVAAARRIAALARAQPEAAYRGSQRARDLAADLAEDLEGTNCSQRLVTELARGL